MAINPANAATAKRARRQNRNLGQKLQGFGSRYTGPNAQALTGGYDPRQASASWQQDPTQVQGGGGYNAVNFGPEGRTSGQQAQFDEGLMNMEFGPDSQMNQYLREYYAANPDQMPVDDGSGSQGTGTEEGGSGWQGTGAVDAIEQGDEAFGQMSEFRNVGLQGQDKAFQEIDDKLQDSLTRQINIINREGLNRQQAIDRGFDQAALWQTGLQEGVEGAFTEGLEGAQDYLEGGERSAIRGLEEGIGEGVEALNPYAQAGVSAQQQAAALSGALGPEAEAQAREAQSESPYQQYLRDQAEKTVLQNASATGGLGGGNVLKALQDRSMALSGQFEQQRMDNLMGLGGQGLTAAGQQAGLYGQQGATAANIYGQTAQQQAQNEQNTAAYIGQSRQEQQAQLTNIAKERGMSEQALAQDMMTNLTKVVSETYGAQAQALLNKVLSSFDYAKMGVDMVPNLIAALNGASPGTNTGAALAGAAGSIIGAILGGPGGAAAGGVAGTNYGGSM